MIAPNEEGDAGRAFASPYADWMVHLNEIRAGRQDIKLQLSANAGAGFDEVTQAAKAFVESTGQPAAPPLPAFPVPTASVNPCFAAHLAGRTTPTDRWFETVDPKRWRNIPEGAVILGVIDIDIALGHRNFRTQSGESRVLSAWQQGARHTKGALPFGDVLFQDDIERLLASHSRDGLTSPLDQDGFNREAHLVNYRDRAGLRGLARGSAHGTHVLGLAGGADPMRDAMFSEKVFMLVVNLPGYEAYGEGGAFLDEYLSYGLRWIAEMHADIVANAGHKVACPLVTNISFGKQAGARDERQEFARAIDTLNAQSNAAPLSIVMPAGNDNQQQVHRSQDLGPSGTKGGGDEDVIEWRILPDDETSNFVEIWTDVVPLSAQDPCPLQIDVQSPGQDPGTFQVAYDGQSRDLAIAAGRVYCDAVVSPLSGTIRFRYLICVTPNTGATGANHTATGKWRIRLRNGAKHPVTFMASIQTDQTTLPGSSVARRSYFEDARYTFADRDGRGADTYSYDRRLSDPDARLLDATCSLQRRGTLNSYAANEDVIVVAGYRASDGRPAPYSASGSPSSGMCPVDPDVALPSDDGYAHFGLVSEGASDGSVRAMRGTSFSCACATRLIIESFLNGGSTTVADVRDMLRGHVVGVGSAAMRFDDSTKVGAGRIAYRPNRRVPRMVS